MMSQLHDLSDTVTGRALPKRITLAAFAALLLLSVVGCAGKQTWADWMEDASHAEHAAPQVPPQIAPPSSLGMTYRRGYAVGDAARPGEGYDTAARNPDFPRTHIALITLDLTSPRHEVRLYWTGSLATQAPQGPWRSCPGRGKNGANCDDITVSNTVDSNCTPKGTFRVAGFSDHLYHRPDCHYATWVVHAPRFIAMHSHTDVAKVPSSDGCIRLDEEVAKLIHNNSIAGVTLIHIDGKWGGGRGGTGK